MAGVSFRRLIEERFAEKIEKAVSQKHKASIYLPLYNEENTGEIERTDWHTQSTVEFISAYDLPGTQVGFDITVKAVVVYDDEDEKSSIPSPDYYILKCTGDFKDRFNDFTINLIDVKNRKPVYEKPLDDQLIPVIKKDDYEKVADEFRNQYCGDEIDYYNGGIDATAVAGNLGLNIVRHPIRKDQSIAGQLYFRDYDARVYDPATDADKILHVSGGTIVVDPRLQTGRNSGAEKNTIMHECVHWVLHRKAYELEQIYDKYLFGIEEYSDESTDKRFEFIESQARALAPRILAPFDIFKESAVQYIKAFTQDDGNLELIDVIEPVIDKLAEDFGISRMASQIRLLDTGFEEAVGAFNYVDDRYIHSYCFTTGSLQPNQTVTIGAKELFYMLSSNQRLQDYLSNGLYQYIDAHLVLNTEKYIQSSGVTSALTRYAYTHMEECCIVFEFPQQRVADYEYPVLFFVNKDAKIDVGKIYEQLTIADRAYIDQSFQNNFLGEMIKHDQDILYSLSGKNYHDWLNIVIVDRKMTKTKLSDLIRIDKDHITRFLNGKKGGSARILAQICLCLHMIPELSEKIITASPYKLDIMGDEEQSLLHMALTSFWWMPIESIYYFLTGNGFYRNERPPHPQNNPSVNRKITKSKSI